MILIALLHDKTWVIINHKNRSMAYLPLVYYASDDHYALMEYEIMSYLYENTASYDKREIIHFEE